MSRNFGALLSERLAAGLHVCVGLDSDPKRIPACAGLQKGLAGAMTTFNDEIVSATADAVAAFKPNSAFYEGAYPPASSDDRTIVGSITAGFLALRRTNANIHGAHPNVPVVLDYKRGDIGKSNVGYRTYAQVMGADAITVPPYLGEESLRPFLDEEGLGVFVLCRTSNQGAGEFQDMPVTPREEDEMGNDPIPLYLYVAGRVAHWQHRAKATLGLVVGATYSEEMARVRDFVGDDIPLLIPGVGAQGGDLTASVRAARRNFIINSSSGVIFASNGEDYAAAARRVVDQMNEEIHAALPA